MRILFVTTTGLALNPRLAKELLLAKEAGFRVSLICFKMNNWSDAISKELMKERITGDLIEINATRENLVLWLTTSFIHMIVKKLPSKWLWVNGLAVHKWSIAILFHLIFIKNKFDIIIGHNLGSLYPCYFYSFYKNIPFVFDVEDYHPGEKILQGNIEEEKKRRDYCMANTLVYANAITFAASN